MSKKEQLVRELDECHARLAKVHSVLDSLEVPRVVSTGAAYDSDQPYDRLIWLLQQGIGAHAHRKMDAKRELFKRATDYLKKMAAVYEEQHGPDPGIQTHPWMIVRWVRGHLK